MNKYIVLALLAVVLVASLQVGAGRIPGASSSVVAEPIVVDGIEYTECMSYTHMYGHPDQVICYESEPRDFLGLEWLATVPAFVIEDGVLTPIYGKHFTSSTKRSI